jgi:hypothetical protein
VNWQHLQTLIWLRWRLRSNQRRRASRGTLLVQQIIMVLAGLAAALAFVIALLVGLFPLRNASADAVMYTWDVAVAAFFMFWMTELLVELQRSELLSLEKLLHLPVSLSGAFVINYLSSFFTPSIILFLPAMIGLALGLVFSRGVNMLLLFPLVACLVVMVTAVTHQFRGWLASLMENKRRRRTVIALTTMAFMLIFQIPNLLNFTGVWGSRPQRGVRQEIRKLEKAFQSGEISRDEYERRIKPIEDGQQAREEETETAFRIANIVIPLGWLPYGARAAVEGRVRPSLLGAFGLALASAVSLRRSYRTTLRLYTGQFSSRTPRHGLRLASQKAVNAQLNTEAARARAEFLEKRLPWMSEQASAIALACFRSLTRAPEAKTMLLSPIILVVLFGSMFLRNNSNPVEFLRPVMASGAITLILFTLIGVAGNQFGFDRSGFRTFVLAAVPRKDILLGKNLALLPVGVGLGMVPVVLLEIVYPMRFDHFIAVLLQNLSMYLVFCIVSNYVSILAPMAIAPGSLKPVKPKGMMILIHLAFFFLLPLVLSTTLFPLGVEFLLSWSGMLAYFPAYLALALLELLGVAYVYPIFLDIQGRMLQNREQRILEVVTAKVE